NTRFTLGFASAVNFPWAKVPMYVSAQIIGALIGACIVFFNYLPHWQETKEQETKLGVYATIPAIRSPFSNLVSEIIGTFVLLMGLMFIGANDFTEGLTPLIVGALIVAIGMSFGGTSGYAIYHSCHVGPSIVHALLPIQGKGGSDWKYAWVPVVGSVLGGVYGAVFYKAIFEAAFTSVFWVLSAVILIILLGAVNTELKKGKTVNN